MIPRIEFEPTAPVPLEGIRVVDLSRLVAGNMVSLQLADQGAEVIKIEDPESRRSAARLASQGLSLHWKVYARNKKSLAIDLRPPGGRDALLDLLATSQVLIENYRPGTLEADGAGPGRAACAQSGAGHRAHHRLRPGRAVSRPARLRHAGGGDVGLRRQERVRRPAAGAAAAGDGRHGRRAVWRLCGDGGAARGRARRQGTGDRPAAAGADDFRPRARMRRSTGSPARSRGGPAAGR